MNSLFYCEAKHTAGCSFLATYSSQTFAVYKTFMNIAAIHINSVTSYKYAG